MATLIDYKGLQVVSPDPRGDGGLAIQNDLKALADRTAGSAYVQGLQLSFASASSVRIGPGSAISSDGTFNIAVAAALTVAVTATGAGALDTGAEAPRTIYYVYVIADSGGATPPAGLLSASATAPLLPAGFNKFRRIGYVVNNANSDFLRFHQMWTGTTRRYHYAVNGQQTRVLDGGNATAFASVACRSVVPSTARLITVQALFAGNDTGAAGSLVARLISIATAGLSSGRLALLRTAGDTHDGLLYRIQSGSATRDGISMQLEMPCSTNQEIQYSVSNAASRLSLSIVGVDDEL